MSSSSSLSDLITCTVCFEAYTLSERHTPFHLSCAHTFCISCLTGLISNSSIACPACREITHIPNNVPCQQVLKRNFTLIALLEQQQQAQQAQAQAKTLEDEGGTMDDEKEIKKSTKKNKNARKRANKKAKKAGAEAITVPQEIKDDSNVANTIFQFRIHLSNITPQIWRTFEVPANLNFRQFHAVIQDVMGWYCCHLHNFKLKDPNSGVLGGEIELMDYQADKYEAPEDMLLQMHPGMSPAMRSSMTAAANRVIRMYERNIKLYQLITLHNTNLTYEYDFGDSWEHQLTLQAIINRQQGVSYPRVTGGARACPPEDVGGPHGYAEFLSIINNPNHREYHDRCDWLRNHLVNYYPFKSEEFNPAKIPWKCVEFEKSQPDQQPD